MRPAYEKQEDREKQGQIAAEICSAWDVDVIPFPAHSAADYLLINKQSELALGELKCRTNRSLQYKTLILSRQKLIRLIACADTLKVPFYLFIQWDDGIFWQQLSAADLLMLKPSIGGRTDRQDAADIENVYEIPTASFQPLVRPK